MSTVSFDKQSIAEMSSKLVLTTDWQYNSEHVRSLLEEYAPFVELAACWSQPGSYTFFTENAADFFNEFLKNVKRSDMVQAKELTPLEADTLPSTYAVSVSLAGSYLGMLLVHISKTDVDLELLNELIHALLPQLSLARYGTTMAEEVEKRTSTDKLTGLWNRNYFNERFREECARVSRTKEQGTIALIGFDELAAMAKVLNSEEHSRLIVDASNLVRRLVRQTDWVVFWDKHEFLVYLTNTQPESAIDVMSRIVSQLVDQHALLQPVIGLCSTIETNSARALIQLSSRRLDLARKDGRKLVACFATREGLKFLQLNSESSESSDS